MTERLPFLTPVQESEGYSFCEPAYAISNRPWCIRKLSAVGRMLSGGIDTKFLCKDDHVNGWDLEVPMSNHHLTRNACPACLHKFMDQTAYQPPEEE